MLSVEQLTKSYEILHNFRHHFILPNFFSFTSPPNSSAPCRTLFPGRLAVSCSPSNITPQATHQRASHGKCLTYQKVFLRNFQYLRYFAHLSFLRHLFFNKNTSIPFKVPTKLEDLNLETPSLKTPLKGFRQGTPWGFQASKVGDQKSSLWRSTKIESWINKPKPVKPYKLALQICLLQWNWHLIMLYESEVSDHWFNLMNFWHSRTYRLMVWCIEITPEL